MRKTILAGILIFGVSGVFAADYLVTMKNDTLTGKLSIQTYGNIDRVQVITSDKKKTVFTAIQLKLISLAGDIYNPVRTDQGYRMMKLVRPGFVSLYLGRKPSGVTGDSFYYDTEFVVKKDGAAIEVPNLGFKKAMSNFLSECTAMKARIQKEELGRKDLDKIIAEYNLCIEDQTKAMLTGPIQDTDSRIIALTDLRSSIDLSSIEGKGDAVDIVTDMLDKTQHHQTVPKYQFDGLRNLLKDSPELLAKFENVASMLAK